MEKEQTPYAMPRPEDHASVALYLAALEGARDLLGRMVFPPHHADRLWRALRAPFSGSQPAGEPPLGSLEGEEGAGNWRDRVLHEEVLSLRAEIGSDPTALLQEAVRIGRDRWAEVALAKGADALARFRGDKSSTLLGRAVQMGHGGVVERMLDSGVSANAELPLGWTPFSLAVFHRQRAMALLLADRGADPSAVAERGQSAFQHAAELGDVDMLRFMEERGARVARDPTSRAHALIGAARCGHLDVVRHLLDDGVRLDGHRHDLLRAAVSHDRTEILDELIERGFDPLERFGERHLLRDVAGDGLVAVLRRLLEHAKQHGVDPTMVEEARRDAEMWLADRRTKGREEALALLSRWRPGPSRAP